MGKLLVASVYADHPRSKSWYDLQLRYLSKTTTSFTHSVYLNGSINIYHKSILIGNTPRKKNLGNKHHVQALQHVMNFFKSQADNYDYFLILDSDCFPIRRHWLPELVAISSDNSGIAAIARYECNDLRPHPSACFCIRSALSEMTFSNNGNRTPDTHCNAVKFFPMKRTNVVNYHRLAYGIYWNTFYHHAAGSRSPSFTAMKKVNENSKITNKKERKMFNKLTKNPDGFLNELSGQKSISARIY